MIKTILLLPGVFAINYAIAQTAPNVKLSDDHPSPGEKITMTYDPTGTVTDGKKNIEASVFYLDNNEYPVADIDLKPNGKLLTGELTIPQTAKAFFVKITSGEDVDDNSGKGYVYLVYKDQQPVVGAYAMKGYFLAGMGNYYAKITAAPAEGVGLYKKEFELHPDSKKDYQRGYYYLIAGKPEYKADVTEGVAMLEKSNDEKELMLATYLLKISLGKNIDSLNAVIKSKFPAGITVKKEDEDVFYRETDVEKRDSIYKVFAKKHPEIAGDKSTSLESFRFQLAVGYLGKGDLANYYKYRQQLKNTGNLPMALNGKAYAWADANERIDDAEKLAKESIDMLTEKINSPVGSPYTSPAQVKKNKLGDYDMCADTYAFVLAKQNKFADALRYEQPIIDRMKRVDVNFYGNYIHILAGLGRYAKAKEYAEKVIVDGQSNSLIRAELKNAFVKINGNDRGFEEYLVPLQAAGHKKAMTYMAASMIDQPAPAFALKDFEGKTVSLTNLKGKIVIIDFWATWCGPCQASFPGMQMAVNKFKTDPNVKFLFIDTRETAPDFIDKVKKFIAGNNYSFHVLFDDNDAGGNQRKVLSAYDVPGIPTKFIIDKTGNIRFKVVGYGGTPEELADDIADMIEIANNPEAYTANQVPAAKKEGTK